MADHCHCTFVLGGEGQWEGQGRPINQAIILAMRLVILSLLLLSVRSTGAGVDVAGWWVIIIHFVIEGGGSKNAEIGDWRSTIATWLVTSLPFLREQRNVSQNRCFNF